MYSMTRWCYYCCKCSCSLSKDEQAALDLNQEINRMIRVQKKNDRRECKLLLLGTGESGKTTFIKQMRIIHDNGYSTEDDRKPFAKLVYQNIFVSIQSLTGAMETLQIPYNDYKNRAGARLVQEVEAYKVLSLDKQYLDAIRRLWQDPGIKACYKRRREYQLLDSAFYYLSSLDRIADEGYVPTKEDILKIRMPTTGINEYCFGVEYGAQKKGYVEKVSLRIVDVGGQKSERRKWIHSFENVDSLLFLASLSEYDQRLEENNSENRMRESLALFNNILLLPNWQKNIGIILFLNKTDILAEKINGSDLSDYFPNYKGPKKNADAAMQFILEMYSNIYYKCTNQENENLHKNVKNDSKDNSGWTFYSHFTCATDTDHIRKTFEDIKMAVLYRSLQSFLLL